MILILLGWWLRTRSHIPAFWMLSLDTAASMVPVQEPKTRPIPAAWHCQAVPVCEENQLLILETAISVASAAPGLISEFL